MKRIYNLFRKEGQQERGVLGLKGHWFGLDKQKHMLYSYLFFDILSKFGGVEQAVAITIAVAVTKEVLDHFGVTNMIFKTGKTNASWPDILATILIPIAAQVINLINGL